MTDSYAATADLRDTMVERQIRTFDVTDLALQAQMKRVPREIFVDDAHVGLAYSDARLPLGAGREMTAPLILARLLKEAHIAPRDRVLIIGGATGYAAALAAGLAASVVSLDDDAALAARASENFTRLGLSNAKSVQGPLEAGAPDGAPYDVIIVDGVTEGAFSPLYTQLAEGGRLIGVVAARAAAPGAPHVGKATLFLRSGGQTSPRALFDASAGALAAFARPAAFVF